MKRIGTLLVSVAFLAVPVDAGGEGGTLSRVSVGPTGGNAEAPAFYVGPWGHNGSGRREDDARFSSNAWFLRTPLAEGSNAYFHTPERLVTEDTDTLRDLYVRKGAQTELVSTGPNAAGPGYDFCGRQFTHPVCPFAASRDGEHAFFAFEEALVPQDTDGGHNDLFERFGASTTLRSTGPVGGNGPYDVCSSFGYPCEDFAVSVDGSRAVFLTSEALVPEDTDFECEQGRHPCADLYEHANGVTRLLTTGPLRGSGYASALLQMSHMRSGPFPVSLDGRHVFFDARMNLVPEDGDTQSLDAPTDVYESFDGTTRLVSTGPINSNTAVDAVWRGASADGTRVFFQMNEALTPDSAFGGGIYERVGGETRRLPLGPPGDRFDTRGTRFYGPSYDGSHVFFSTRQRLSSEDTDDRWDLYAYSSNGIELISTGPGGGNGAFDVCSDDGFGPCIEAASRDGRTVYFTTREPLVSTDEDTACPEFVGGQGSCEDIYVRDLSSGTTRLVSAGRDSSDGVPFDFLFLDAISADGSRAFFRTQMSLVPQDADGGRLDLYERFAGRTRLLSTGPAATNAATNVSSGGSTADGRLVFFGTAERLLAGDTDSQPDVYRVDVNEPPDCSGVVSSRSVLSTANRRLVPITLDGAGDPDGDPVTLSVDGVTQDEPVTGRGDHTAPDAVDKGEGELRIRAERDPHGDGRVYRIAFTASDGRGGSCAGNATVSVPRKKNKQAVDSAPPSYDSFAR